MPRWSSPAAQGRAPNIVLHLPNGSQWSLRASLITSDADAFYLLQMSALGARRGDERPRFRCLDQILRRLPDAFVLVDRDGAILKANPTFLDLAQVGVEGAVARPEPAALAFASRRGFLRDRRTSCGATAACGCCAAGWRANSAP